MKRFGNVAVAREGSADNTGSWAVALLLSLAVVFFLRKRAAVSATSRRRGLAGERNFLKGGSAVAEGASHGVTSYVWDNSDSRKAH